MDTLLRYTFQPDYTVRACTELLYLKVKRSLYLAAKKASLMEFSQKDTNAATGEFDAEVEKVGCFSRGISYDPTQPPRCYLFIFYYYYFLISIDRFIYLLYSFFQYFKDPEECLLLTKTQALLNDEFKEF